jgi:hypothetical protein
MFSVSYVFVLDNSNKYCKRVNGRQMEERKQSDELAQSEPKTQQERDSGIAGPRAGRRDAQSSLGRLRSLGGGQSESAKRFSRNLRCVRKESKLAANTT